MIPFADIIVIIFLAVFLACWGTIIFSSKDMSEYKHLIFNAALVEAILALTMLVFIASLVAE